MHLVLELQDMAGNMIALSLLENFLHQSSSTPREVLLFKLHPIMVQLASEEAAFCPSREDLGTNTLRR
jgi:hypothetical protein